MRYAVSVLVTGVREVPMLTLRILKPSSAINFQKSGLCLEHHFVAVSCSVPVLASMRVVFIVVARRAHCSWVFAGLRVFQLFLV